MHIDIITVHTKKKKLVRKLKKTITCIHVYWKYTDAIYIYLVVVVTTAAYMSCFNGKWDGKHHKIQNRSSFSKMMHGRKQNKLQQFRKMMNTAAAAAVAVARNTSNNSNQQQITT